MIMFNTSLKRLIAGGILVACAGAVLAKAPVQSTVLLIKKYPITIDGKETQLFRIEQPDGTWGYHGIEGDFFDAVVKNTTDKPTVIHWHGLIVPNNQDGVPYVTQEPIPPGGEYHYRFKLKQSGTYWMHSHHDLQVQQFLSAPFIINEPQEDKTTKQVTLFIGDFSYKSPEAIFSELKKGNMAHSGAHMNHNTMANMDSMKTDKPAADLNDVTYDAFLTNYRTLQNPEIVSVIPGQIVRLRLIAGSAMTNFFVNTGTLEAQAIAADGQKIIPFNGNEFQLAVGQRMDVLVTIPKQGGTYPILAQGEGTSMQTGLILTTDRTKINTLSETTKNTAGALNYAQEFKLHALAPLKKMKPGQTLTVNLEGTMKPYSWTINKQAWPEIKPLLVTPNKRIEMVFVNKTPMAHPMHLHGHVFQVTEIDGKQLANGVMRDTVLVLPKSTVKVQFDSDNPGNWMMHCHMLYHQESGMMTIMNYPGVKMPTLIMKHQQ
ncbi:Copper resistance protein A (plasmid) [Legionella pneumophila subsp. pneumophila LPE509]|nr:Copper resistance protein A [Legionella pneumophila subsp. pneumophila LPE509]